MAEVYLRMFNENDYIQLYKWRNDPDIQRLVSGPFKYVSLEMEKEWVKSKMLSNRVDIYLAICVIGKDGNEQMIGYTSINGIDNACKKAELGGILIGEKKYHNGVIVYQVGLKTLELAFDHLGLNRLSNSCLAEHTTSVTQILARGFQLEGTLRKSVFKNGCFHDQYIFSILKEEFDTLRTEGYYNFNNYLNRISQLSKK